MSAEKLVKNLAERISRRTFLAKLGVGTVSALLGLMGLQGTALAAVTACCVTCNTSQTRCYNCTCIWCWCCCYNNEQYACCECYSTGGSCSGSCSGSFCSYVYPTNRAC